MSYGIDYASIDGNKTPAIDMSKASGNTFVIQRAVGDGFSPVEDQHYDRDRALWRKAGVAHGGYLIMSWPTKKRATAEPEAQAQKLIDAIGPLKPGELPPTLDVEFGATKGRVGSVLSARQATEWVERAYDVLVKAYGLVMIYTSARVWYEDLQGFPSKKLGDAVLWIKTGYVFDRLNPMNVQRFTPIKEVPAPWRGEGPGTWIHQIQGDARPVPGFTSTTDINLFRYMKIGEKSTRVRWVQDILLEKGLYAGAIDGDFGPKTDAAVRRFQSVGGQDGVIGPNTFVKLCAAKSAQNLAKM